MSARSLAEARLRGRPEDGEDARDVYRESIGCTRSTSRWYYDPEVAGIGIASVGRDQGTERARVDFVAPAQGQKTLSNARQSGRKQEEKQRGTGASMENENASKAGETARDKPESLGDAGHVLEHLVPAVQRRWTGVASLARLIAQRV
ncbi:hypothetical protein S40293_10641 [Stachybotrys chartarum IBT 40293]|nr:hypothetical protein S40293_10641 [Stachybotrys chartarum IBT 40293]